jgi:hypothetical protein
MEKRGGAAIDRPGHIAAAINATTMMCRASSRHPKSLLPRPVSSGTFRR